MWLWALSKLPWLKYWKYAATAMIAVILIVTYFYVRNLRTENTSLKTQLIQAEANFTKCQEDGIKSKEISSDYQKSNSSLKSQLDRLRRSSKCIVPYNGSRSVGTAAEGKLSGSDGISTGWLYEFAGRAEETRLKLIGCQKFVSDVCSR